MSLDYTIFKATDEKSEKNKNRNYFDFNPHLKFLIDRYGPEDVELTRDIMKMLGELSAQHLALKAEENDREGCKLQWCVGEQILTDAEYQKFNELQSVESYQPSDSQDKVDKAVTAFRNNDKIPIRSDVVLPQGAREQIKLLREQDLFGLPLPEKYGGTALSQMIAGAALFFYSQADSSLMLRVMLTEGVADLIENFATEELKEKFIPALCSGQSEKSYTGAMVITEPDAGSDLRGISVKAVKKGEGYLLGGRKIFITNPDAEVLIVLARIEGARPGTLKGLTLFLVPKYLSGEDGEKVSNRVIIENLEEKLGIHASPTGTLFFKGAKAHRIGEEGDGLKQMLYLMNKSRLGIGTQGLGIAERAFLESAVFCTERKQFGKIIAELPLMREILADMRIEIEAAASFIFRAYHYIDRYLELRKQNGKGDLSEQDKANLEKYEKLVRILTPLAKYCGSELSVTIADAAVGNLGGYGYINEYKVERLIRDAKITTIYEGTNNMMVLDVQRSMAREGTLDYLIADSQSNLENVKNPLLIPYKEKTRQGLEHIREAAKKISTADHPAIAAQVEARKFAELLINVYQASLMLEEAEYLIGHEQDWRKAVMAMKYIDDKLSAPGKNITAKLLSLNYFDNIFYHEKLAHYVGG